MNFKCSLLVASLFVVAPLAQSATPVNPVDIGAVSTFSLAHQTQVPGEVLKPGDYSIQIVEHISDRMIVRIDNAQSKHHFLFLGVPKLDAVASDSAPGVQTWRSGAGSLPTLRGFTFPAGTAVDFVYPKADAAALAKANAATIIAIDPESEGRPIKLSNLSSDDMREINLWMLTLTSAGPADNKVPALEAKRYQAPASSQVAAGNAVPSGSAGTTRTEASYSAQRTQVAKLDQPMTPSAGSARRNRIAKELPHTASFMPLVWLVGCASFFTAALLFAFRNLFGAASLKS